MSLARIYSIDTLYTSQFTAHGQVRGKLAPLSAMTRLVNFSEKPSRFEHNQMQLKVS